ncbi:MAG: sodium:solute symporter [Sedimentisphaeraceae bacterium JB056]
MLSLIIRPLDIAVILLFLVGMAAVGVYFATRNKSTEDYFLGNRSFPGWAIGLSMLGTSISSVTFLALPAAAFVLDYRNIVPNLMLPFVAVAAILIFIPIFRKGRITSAFEYLEGRFGHLIRLYASLSFIVLQLLRLSTVLYLVSIPISILTGQSIILVVIVGGVFIGFYTVLGGFEAVIWTDVVQTLILLLGGILCFISIMTALPEGLPQIFEIGREYDKFSIGPIEWGLNQRTFFVMAIMGLISFTTEYSSNQNVIQRYLAAKTMKEARKATLLCAVMSVPMWLLFFFLGTCLFVYYKVYPSQAVTEMNADQILPYFILTKIPAGVAGLIVAACLAAAMSSLDSSINSIATIFTVDVLKRYLAKNADDAYYLAKAKLVSMAAGVLMILGAIAFDNIPRESMVDLGFILNSVFGGCVLGIYMLGFFAKRVGYKAILIGTASAIIVNIYLMMNYFGWLPQTLSVNVHAYATVLIVNAVLIVVSLLVSFISSPESEIELAAA